MGNTILVPIIAMLVLGAIWQLTFMRTKSTIAAFATTSVSLGFIVFQLLLKNTTPLMAYFVASSVFGHAWVFAWFANECIPAVRGLLREEDNAIFPTFADQNTKGGE